MDSYNYLDKIMAILISLMFLMNVFLCRIKIGHIIHPSIIINVIWFLYTFIPLVFLFEAPINLFSILYIYCCISLFTISAFIFNWKRAANRFHYDSKKSIFNDMQSSPMLFFSIACCVLAIFFGILTIMQNGWSLTVSLLELLSSSGQYAKVRGNEGMIYGLYGTLATLFTYTTPILCGLMFNTANKTSRNVLLVAVAFIPGVFTMVSQSSKLVFLISLCFFLGSFLLYRLHSNQSRLFTVKIFLNFWWFCLFFTPFVLFSVLSREGYSDLGPTAVIDNITYAFNSYLLGQIYAFSDFLSYYLGMPSKSSFFIDSYSYGAYTFYSILNTFGYTKEFMPGMYAETGYLQGVFETNIFTIFRGVINDFGLVGSFSLFGFLGLLVNYSFYKMLCRSDSIFLGLVFIGVFVAICMSYLFSVFLARYMYSTILLAFILLKINKYWCRNNKGRMYE